MLIHFFAETNPNMNLISELYRTSEESLRVKDADIYTVYETIACSSLLCLFSFFFLTSSLIAQLLFRTRLPFCTRYFIAFITLDFFRRVTHKRLWSNICAPFGCSSRPPRLWPRPARKSRAYFRVMVLKNIPEISQHDFNCTNMLSDAAGAATRESERPAAGDASVARAVPPGTRSRPLARTIPEALR